MNQECGSLVIAPQDLGAWTDTDDFLQRRLWQSIPVSDVKACALLLAWEATNNYGQRLGFPVDVQNDATSGVGADAGVR
jgi:hypothetical protein